jgi:septal ring factor EnvC (AmiA/AmiB activator)
MKQRKTVRKKKTHHITQSVPFYVISIFFAQFIHTNMIKEPTIGHAVFALMASFGISFCLIYTVEFISKSVVNFHVNMFENIKSLNKTIDSQRKEIQILKDQKSYTDHEIAKLREELKGKDN